MSDREKIKAKIDKLERDFEQEENYRRKLTNSAERAVVWDRMKQNEEERKRLHAQLALLSN